MRKVPSLFSEAVGEVVCLQQENKALKDALIKHAAALIRGDFTVDPEDVLTPRLNRHTIRFVLAANEEAHKLAGLALKKVADEA